MMADLGIVEYQYTLDAGATFKEKLAYAKQLNTFIKERVWATGLHPIRVRVDFIGLKKGKLQYVLSERSI